MRIDGSVSISREMFSCDQQPIRVRTANEGVEKAFGPVTIEEYQLFRVRKPVRGELAVLRDGRTVIKSPLPEEAKQ